MRQHYKFRVVKISPWQFWIAAALTIALVTTVAIVAAGLFLFIAPIVLIGALIYRLLAPSQRTGAHDPRVIDAQYTVVDENNDRPGRKDGGDSR
jgi:hypothetical protein